MFWWNNTSGVGDATIQEMGLQEPPQRGCFTYLRVLTLGRNVMSRSSGISIHGDSQTLTGHIPEQATPPGSALNLPSSHLTYMTLSLRVPSPSTARP